MNQKVDFIPTLVIDPEFEFEKQGERGIGCVLKAAKKNPIVNHFSKDEIEWHNTRKTIASSFMVLAFHLKAGLRKVGSGAFDI